MKIKKSWKVKDQANFLKRLSDLLERGYTLNEGLTFLQLNETGTRKEELFICIQRLAKGDSLRAALTELQFHRDVLSYLYFAEQHGDLQFALKESSGMLMKKMIQMDKLMKLLRYPIFLLFTIIIILSIVNTVIMPQFQQLFGTMNIEPSFFSVFLLTVFDLFKWLFFILLFFILCLGLYYFFDFKKKQADDQMSILLNIPIFNKLLRMFNSYFFAVQLSNLLRGGLSIFESLTIFKKQNMLPFFKMEAAFIIEQLRKGERLESIMEENHFYERELGHVILHGQANGQLARELYTYSQFIIDQLEAKILKMITVIQPTIYILVGLVILFVYLSMLLPMYEMIEHI
ncbi:competence type IV pilus assembly protein ComGB [Metabacillus fastidiosus]|uniref:Competence type IV pilus assembly protein ComGB n=1 Tax=Metabacillus fastidiosus TaxID=1458 RepID=A0ABU6NUZ1_9BACI|nr:competence type IV pilus assembly protein ComGB [Metabacillus fastidiosus]MED4400919.1 competence type IV pilus assembly protein ComGB [Metabacillus fastidiosus]MED4463845.1 competence type IV pilus assembly protein ComGB [Metabacillus fastidiosus]